MNKPKKHWLDYTSAAALVLAFFILVILNIFWGNHWIDSDMAAEMIFSKLLTEEGRLIATPDWYYSTEFRILYTQLIMVPLHHVFSDWHVIRVLTNIVFYLMMLASFFFACKPLHIRKRNVCLCALALLVPVSEAVMTHLQMGNTYMSHVILCFCVMGLFLRLSNKEDQGSKKQAAYAVIFGILCVILGISGVRYLLDILVPLVLTAVVYVMGSTAFGELRQTPSKKASLSFLQSERVRYVWVSGAGVVCGGVGYLINALYISKIYQFQTYDTTNFISIHDGVFFNRVQNAVGQLLQMFGYIENKAFLSLRGIITILSFVMLFVLGFVWVKCMTYRNKEQAGQGKHPEECSREFIVLFSGVSLLLHLFVFVFTTSTMADRYFIPIAIFFLMTLAVYMEWEALAFDRVAVCLILGGCLTLAGVKTYYSFVNNDKNENRYEMAEYLVSEGYEFGYASYWNSNIMTEISDGRLDMANLWSLESLGDFKWSSKVSSYEPKEGKLFLIAGKDELYAVEEAGMLEKQKVIFENEAFIVLHFDSQQEFWDYRQE